MIIVAGLIEKVGYRSGQKEMKDQLQDLWSFLLKWNCGNCNLQGNANYFSLIFKTPSGLLNL